MSYLSHVLEWVRALLFGPHRPDGRNRTHTVHTSPDQSPKTPDRAVQPTPEVWDAALVLARPRRAVRTPAAIGGRHDEGETLALVRAYVLSPEERSDALSARQLTGVGR